METNQSIAATQANDSSLTKDIRTVEIFDAKVSKARESEILVVRRIRKTKNAVAGKVAKTVSVPRFQRAEIVSSIESMMPAIEGLIHSARVSVFGKVCDSVSFVNVESLNLAACIAELNEGRMNAESIAEWFAECLANELTDALAAKVSNGGELTDVVIAKIEKSVSNYLALFQGLSSGRTQYTPNQRQGLRKALELIGEDSTTVRFIARLDSMETKDSELLDML